MTTLALAVDADDELWTLDALPTPEAPYVTVGDELIEVRARFPSQIYSLTGQALPPKIRVRRGIAGTTKASHIQGSTLTPNYGLGGGAGAGGVTVDNQSDPPAEVTTLIAPGADVSTPGEATLFSAVIPRLLGPFRVNFDTTDISDVGVSLAGSEFAAGTAIIRAWASYVAAWNPAGEVELQVLDWETQIAVGLYNAKTTSVVGAEMDRTKAGGPYDYLHGTRAHFSPIASSIGVYVDIASGTATAGAADIFAFVVEPAS